MRRICGKKLTLAVVASLLAGTVPAWAADVTGQQVTVDEDRTENLLYGGDTASGNASKNTLSVTGSASITDNDMSSGGYAENGEAVGNQVNFSSSGSHQIEAVFGGMDVQKPARIRYPSPMGSSIPSSSTEVFRNRLLTITRYPSGALRI